MKWLSWSLLMSQRLSRRSKSKLFLFSLAVVLGTASFVAIDGFKNNIYSSLDGEAKELLGADFQASAHQPFSDSAMLLMNKYPGEHAEERFFTSMARLPNNDVKFVQVHALKGPYPFYGEIETIPASAASTFRSKKAVLVDKSIFKQYNIKVGDSLKLGKSTFVIEGELIEVPRQASFSSAFAPAVYLPMDYLEETELIKPGSRIMYYQYLNLKNGKNLSKIFEELEPELEKLNVNLHSYESRKERLGKAFGLLGNYLTMIALVALLLGGIGISGAIQTYIQTLKPQISTLKCIGATSRQILATFLIQLLGVGFLGAVIGILLGLFLQVQLPAFLGEYIPVEVNFSLSVSSVLYGLLLSLSVVAIFSLPPLLSAGKTSPMDAVRNSFQAESSFKNTPKSFYLFSFLFIYGLTWLQTESWLSALIFLVGLATIFVLLYFISGVMINWFKPLAAKSKNFALKQGFRNLYRPNNQTVLMLASLSLGITIITILFNVENCLTGEFSIDKSEDRPNLILFDIRTEQNKGVTEFMENSGVNIIDKSPIVAMRLEAINGRKAQEIKEDPESEIPEHVLDREYRTTFRSYISDNETIEDGQWIDSIGTNDEPVVSLAQTTAEQMGVTIGDHLTFNIQGIKSIVKVASIRKVNWTSFSTNFTVVFPKGFLEEAPQQLAFTALVKDLDKKAMFQRKIVEQFPNVNVLDLDEVIDSVSEIVEKIVLAIQFLAYFSLLTGIVILISSVNNTRLIRQGEQALLRIIGFPKSLINRSNFFEFIFLGIFAAVIGSLIGIGVSYLLVEFVFSVGYTFSTLTNAIIITGSFLLVVITGIWSNRSQSKLSALDSLRQNT